MMGGNSHGYDERIKLKCMYFFYFFLPSVQPRVLARTHLPCITLLHSLNIQHFATWMLCSEPNGVFSIGAVCV